jgi:hypothetical protein
MALKMLEAYYTHAYPAMMEYLKYLGHKHHMREVLPELCPAWGDALLAALEQFHGDARLCRRGVTRPTFRPRTAWHLLSRRFGAGVVPVRQRRVGVGGVKATTCAKDD